MLPDVTVRFRRTCLGKAISFGAEFAAEPRKFFAELLNRLLTGSSVPPPGLSASSSSFASRVSKFFTL